MKSHLASVHYNITFAYRRVVFSWERNYTYKIMISSYLQTHSPAHQDSASLLTIDSPIISLPITLLLLLLFSAFLQTVRPTTLKGCAKDYRGTRAYCNGRDATPLRTANGYSPSITATTSYLPKRVPGLHSGVRATCTGSGERRCPAAAAATLRKGCHTRQGWTCFLHKKSWPSVGRLISRKGD